MIARVARLNGLKAVALDVTFDRVTNRPGAMDLTTPSGFAFPTCIRILLETLEQFKTDLTT